MLRRFILIFSLLTGACGCNPQPATVGPKPSEMVGHYTTTDSRAAGATLDVRADGTFILANWPGTNGTGSWKVEQNDVSKIWQFKLMFTAPQALYVSGYQILGEPGNYSLGFFVGDPDEGAVVLQKHKP